MKQSVNQLFNLYISRSDLAESSIALKSRAVKLFIRFFGDLPAGQIRREHAEDYKLMLIKGNERSKSSANFYLANISPFFEWLVSANLLDRNPFRGIRRYVAERKIRPIFTAEEVKRILCLASPRWRVIVRLSVECSLRRSEILNVCRDDLQDKWLHIQGKRKTADTWPWSIKNHAEALVLISESLQKDLNGLKTEIPFKQPYLIVPPKIYRKNMHLQAENSLTFELRGCPYGNFSRDFRRLLRNASVRPKRFQDLRGTYATVLLENGMKLSEVSKVMRHSSMQTTQKFYIRYDQRDLAAKSAKIVEEFYASNVR